MVFDDASRHASGAVVRRGVRAKGRGSAMGIVHPARVLASVATLLGGSIAAAPQAVSVESYSFVFVDEASRLVSFTAGTSQANNLVVTQTFLRGVDGIEVTRYDFNDDVWVRPGAGCESWNEEDDLGHVVCTLPYSPDTPPFVRIRLGSKDDTGWAGIRFGKVRMEGGDGSDRLSSVRAELFGGDGADVLWGGVVTHGGAGSDVIRESAAAYGDAGNDRITGTLRSDVIHGGTGADLIRGAGGNDEVFGNSGDDLIFGNAGNDTLSGGPGDDTVSGGQGRDTVVGGPGVDTLSGGAGSDRVTP
jgi:hypothetical protein